MRLKIFEAHGHDRIEEMEFDINEWLSKNEKANEVVKTETATCGVGGCGTEELYQYVIVSIWFKSRVKKEHTSAK